MDSVELCQRYFKAWMRRDAGAILETIAPGGTYEDPTTPGPLGGEALRGYLGQLWAAFPDLGFELGRVQALDNRVVLGQWTMTGTNAGSLQGLPPTGKQVRLPGVDLIESGDLGIERVVGYFDSALLPRQLGLDVLVQPREIGPFCFGAASAVRRAQPALPGAVGVTEIVASSDEAVQRVRDLAREIVGEQLHNEGFLSFTGTVVGRRLTTLSCWTSAEALQAAMRGGAHVRSMREFFESPAIEGGSTGVYTRLRAGPFHRRCIACGRMASLPESGGWCGCGAALQAIA